MPTNLTGLFAVHFNQCFINLLKNYFRILDKALKTRSIYSDSVLSELWPMNTPNATATLNFRSYKFKLMTDVSFFNLADGSHFVSRCLLRHNGLEGVSR